jgi:hypothetical protein
LVGDDVPGLVFDRYDVEEPFGGSSFAPPLDERSLDLAADLDETEG